ncbi:hypothetical protein FPZ43_14300 [Mucilaginibacter pallidiroseus]|uniref:Uncharacterized protein n=1 Tax=Mucilaginibacter pallidiroseus TaxID=2599295 RepID=A0A563U4T3_9SPHI|nr:hypothetical protein [Mucilaginibacter pallidiroseus]TWR26333.1 hypothetical protein FPZ43_14300 [Mucilaginibacter pallidiroseus]
MDLSEGMQVEIDLQSVRGAQRWQQPLNHWLFGGVTLYYLNDNAYYLSDPKRKNGNGFSL